VGVAHRVQHPHHPAEPRHRFRGLGAHLHLRHRHRRLVRQGLRHVTRRPGRWSLVNEAGRDRWHRLFWGAGSLLVVVYALIPVLWILSLSFKPASELNDRRFIPDTFSLDNYRTVIDDPQFPAAVRNSVGIAAISTVL